AAAADHDGRVRLLHRLRLAASVGQLHVAAIKSGHLLAQQADNRLDALVEAVETLAQRRQLDAVGITLQLVPAGAYPDFEPAGGDDVHGRGHVRQDRWMPVDHAAHLAADPDPARGLCHRGEHRPALQVRAGEIAGERVEVIPVPGRLEDLDLVGGDPYRTHLRPGLMLGPGLDSEVHGSVLLECGGPNAVARMRWRSHASGRSWPPTSPARLRLPHYAPIRRCCAAS